MATVPNSKLLKALVVDPDDRARRLIAGMLGAEGLSGVGSAPSYEAAVAVLAAEPPHLVVLDGAAPEVRAFDLVAWIRRDAASPDPFLPILLIAPEADDVLAAQALGAGVDAVVTAPLSLGDLTARVRALIFQPRPFWISDTYLGPNRRRGLPGDVPRDRRRSHVPIEAPPPGRIHILPPIAVVGTRIGIEAGAIESASVALGGALVELNTLQIAGCYRPPAGRDGMVEGLLRVIQESGDSPGRIAGAIDELAPHLRDMARHSLGRVSGCLAAAIGAPGTQPADSRIIAIMLPALRALVGLTAQGPDADRLAGAIAASAERLMAARGIA